MLAHRDVCTNNSSGSYGRYSENQSATSHRTYYPSVLEQTEYLNSSSFVTSSESGTSVPSSSSQQIVSTTNSTLSNSTSGSPFYRGIPTSQQSLFNPLLPSQGSQAMYGSVFASPTGFSIPQGTFSPSGFHGFGQSDPLWPSVPPDVHTPMSSTSYSESSRSRHCVEKSTTCDTSHSCYINKRSVIGNTMGYCSALPPLGPFKTSNRDVPCLQSKVGMDPQACCFGQSVVGYPGQSVSQNNYKSNEQYSCTLPPVNHYLSDHNDLKRSSESCVTELCEVACFESSQAAASNKSVNHVHSEEVRVCSKEHSRSKSLTSEKCYERISSVQTGVMPQQNKHQVQECYTSVETYNSSDFHNETCYTQPPYVYQMNQSMLFSRTLTSGKTDGYSHDQHPNQINVDYLHKTQTTAEQEQHEQICRESDKRNVDCTVPPRGTCETTLKNNNGSHSDPCGQKTSASHQTYESTKDIHCSSGARDDVPYQINVDTEGSLDQENPSLLLEHYTQDVSALQNENSLPDSIQLCSDNSEILIEDVEVGVTSNSCNVDGTRIDSVGQETSSEIIVEETEGIDDERGEVREQEDEEAEDTESEVRSLTYF